MEQGDKLNTSEKLLTLDTDGLSVYSLINQCLILGMELFKVCITLCATLEKEFSKDQIKFKLVNFQKYKKATKYDAF
jgi:hypothetical protein